MRQHAEQLKEADTAVFVITFDAEWMVRGYIEQTQMPWPILMDSDKSVYRTYGLGKGSWWSIYGPASILSYLRLIFGKGRRVERPGSDYRQLGGDVLIDRKGLIRFYHASQSPHDRPEPEEILETLARISSVNPDD